MFSTGVGNTDAAFIMGTGKIWEKVPESIKFTFNGKMPEYLTAKDLILHILGDIGTDGATYCAMEFDGEAIESLSMYERMTLTNMAIETGAISGIIAVDEVTEKFLEGRVKGSFEVFKSDSDAKYLKTFTYDVSKLKPVVAKPHSPDKRALVSDLIGTKVTKCYIGSCTGGKITDFRFAARVLSGHKVKVPTYIVPGSVEVAKMLDEEVYEGTTLKDIFLSAGCSIAPPSCAACLGGPSDTFGRSVDGDVVVSTTNRNFPGRMGSKNAGVYLASPLTVAASAVQGAIADPAELM